MTEEEILQLAILNNTKSTPSLSGLLDSDQQKGLLAGLGALSLFMPRPAGTNTATNLINNLQLGAKLVAPKRNIFPPKESAFQQEVGKAQGKLYSDVMAQGQSATQNQQIIDNLLALKNRVTTGTGDKTVFYQQIETFAQNLGLENVALPKNDFAALQALDTIANSQSLQRLSSFKGSTSDKELDFIGKTNLGKNLTPVAFDIKYQIDSRANQLSVVRARAMDEYTQSGKLMPNTKRLLPSGDTVGFDTFFKLQAKRNGFDLETIGDDGKTRLLTGDELNDLKMVQNSKIRLLNETQYNDMDIALDLRTNKMDYFNPNRWQESEDPQGNTVYKFQFPKVKDGDKEFVEVPDIYLNEQGKLDEEKFKKYFVISPAGYQRITRGK